MTWWLQAATRFKDEQAAIAELEANSPWLKNVSWLPGTRLEGEIHFEIEVDGGFHPMTLFYPSHFPMSPPRIVPKAPERLSGHQWNAAAGGELCLQYRPDNWQPQVTGAMMITSAYDLLAGERGKNGPGIVPSAHFSSLGQRTRGTYTRFILPVSFRGYVERLPEKCVQVAEFNQTFIHVTHVVVPSAFGSGDEKWRDETVPSNIFKVEGFLLKVPTEQSVSESLSNDDLIRFAEEFSHSEAAAALRSKSYLGVVITNGIETIFGWCSEDSGARKVEWYKTIAADDAADSRLPEDYSILQTKSVCFIGCGSLGSKIASMLARAGVGKILLVDDDIFMPVNIVRHDLDWQYVGHHKPAALRARIKNIHPSCDVTIRTVALGGQESAQTTSEVMELMSKCDLIIEASVCPQAFNYSAAVSLKSKIPMVWAEVFAGGIGGMVARTRPEIEPPPHVARGQILEWCNEQNVPAPGRPRRYGVEHDDGSALIADDADVSVIASHAGRVAIDALLRRTNSIFPHPVYFIGMTKAWIFTAPFDTRPVDLRPEPWKLSADSDVDTMREVGDFLISLMPKTSNDDETDPSAQSNIQN
ncbi:MAG: ThiF family adenylyltransferase [Alphaproteobacteria bacterium]